MRQQSKTTQRDAHTQTVRSWRSAEDDAYVAEVEGVPGALIHGNTEQEARDAALKVPEEWRAVEQWLAQLSADDFITLRKLDPEAAKQIRSRSADGPSHRPLQQWNHLLTDLGRQ
jgi:predicted RNase H-like HicB family nuclease